MLRKIEFDILEHLLGDGLLDQMNSRTIKNISKKLDVNYYRIRTNLNHLMLLGFVKCGCMERNSKTFYISKEGINQLKTLRGDINE